MYPVALSEITIFFEALTDQERRENLVVFADQAQRYEPLEGEGFDFQDMRKDVQCVDAVGIFLRVNEHQRVHFAIRLGPKVQTLTRAMAAILCRGLEGATAQEVLGVPLDFVPRIVGAELMRMRSQTVYYILERMKEAVQRAINLTEPVSDRKTAFMGSASNLIHEISESSVAAPKSRNPAELFPSGTACGGMLTPLVRLQPVLARAGLDEHGHAQRQRLLHACHNHGRDPIDFVLRHFEEKFVMNL